MLYIMKNCNFNPGQSLILGIVVPGARDRVVTVLQIILTSTARAHFPVRVLSLSIFVLGRISSTSSFSEKSIFNLKSSNSQHQIRFLQIGI